MTKQQAQATSNNNAIFAQALATLASTQKQARQRDSIIASNANNGFATITKQACKHAKTGFVYVLHNGYVLAQHKNGLDILQALGIANDATKLATLQRNRIDYNKAQALLNIASTQPQAVEQMHIAIATSATE